MMPWEIDYMGLTFANIKETLLLLRAIPSMSYVNFTIDSALNLSSNIIDWDKSKLPKEYFIEKYNTFSLLLRNPDHPKWGSGPDTEDEYLCKHNQKIYEGEELYGHLDLQRACIGEEFDYYVHICPDLNFTPYALISLIEGAIILGKKKNPYFVVTSSISKMWDDSWDEIIHPSFNETPYDDWWKTDPLDVKVGEIIGSHKKSRIEFKFRQVTKTLKWAGWCDLYSKDLYEHILKTPKDWKGYGPWDLYSILSVVDLSNNYSLEFIQIVTNTTVTKFSLGPLNTTNKPANTGNWLQSPIKNQLSLKDNTSKQNQRITDEKVEEYVRKNIEEIMKDKKLIKKFNLNKNNKNIKTQI